MSFPYMCWKYMRAVAPVRSIRENPPARLGGGLLVNRCDDIRMWAAGHGSARLRSGLENWLRKRLRDVSILHGTLFVNMNFTKTLP